MIIMNKILFITAAALCLTAAGCKDKPAGNGEATIISADFKKALPSLDLSDILEDRVEIIPLETTDESILGEISDIRIVGDEIFVTQGGIFQTGKIAVFDRNGKYLRQIGHPGRGPHEFMTITASEVTDDRVVVYDNLSNKLLFWNHDGTPAGFRDASDLWGMDIVQVGDILYLVNAGSSSGQGYYYLFELTPEGEFIKPLLPFDEDTPGGAGSVDHYYSKNGEELLVFSPPYDSLYVVRNGGLDKLFFVDFGPRKVPESVLRLEGYGETALAVIRNNYIAGVGAVHLTDRYVMISFMEKEHYIALYNRENGECSVYKSLANPLCPGLPYLLESSVIRDNEWIVAVNAPLVKAIVEGDPGYTDPSLEKNDFQRRMIELSASLDDLDNPVLFVQKFK